jgi:N-acetylglucosamine-6-phosphate deacetylase
VTKFFDLQVNGYAGVDFNADDLALEQAAEACRRLAADGVDGILATIITDELATMRRRIARVAELRDADADIERMIQGIHVEGPFISGAPGYVGTHRAECVQTATVAAAEALVEAGAGLVRLVTLAPECDAKFAVTRWLADRGVRVAAGHCKASLETLRAALDNGLSMFTHLGNGCPLVLPRHDNIVQRVLSLADRLWITFIADGVHVPEFALRNYIRCAGVDRAIVVSDAIAAAGLGPGQYALGGQPVVVDEHLATWSADGSHLMGSAVTMPRAFANLQDQLGLTAAEAQRLVDDNPRAALGM